MKKNRLIKASVLILGILLVVIITALCCKATKGKKGIKEDKIKMTTTVTSNKETTNDPTNDPLTTDNLNQNNELAQDSNNDELVEDFITYTDGLLKDGKEYADELNARDDAISQLYRSMHEDEIEEINQMRDSNDELLNSVIQDFKRLKKNLDNSKYTEAEIKDMNELLEEKSELSDDMTNDLLDRKANFSLDNIKASQQQIKDFYEDIQNKIEKFK